MRAPAFGTDDFKDGARGLDFAAFGQRAGSRAPAVKIKVREAAGVLTNRRRNSAAVMEPAKGVSQTLFMSATSLSRLRS